MNTNESKELKKVMVVIDAALICIVAAVAVMMVAIKVDAMLLAILMAFTIGFIFALEFIFRILRDVW